MIWDALQKETMGKIMHICGQMKNVYPQAELIHSDVLSFDSCVSMREAREHFKKARPDGKCQYVDAGVWTA